MHLQHPLDHLLRKSLLPPMHPHPLIPLIVHPLLHHCPTLCQDLSLKLLRVHPHHLLLLHNPLSLSLLRLLHLLHSALLLQTLKIYLIIPMMSWNLSITMIMATPSTKNGVIPGPKLWQTGAKHEKNTVSSTLNFLMKPPPLDLNLVEVKERIRGSLLESGGSRLLALHIPRLLAFLPRTNKP